MRIIINYISTLWDGNILCLVVSKTNKVIPKIAKCWLRTKRSLENTGCNTHGEIRMAH